MIESVRDMLLKNKDDLTYKLSEAIKKEKVCNDNYIDAKNYKESLEQKLKEFNKEFSNIEPEQQIWGKKIEGTKVEIKLLFTVEARSFWQAIEKLEKQDEEFNKKYNNWHKTFDGYRLYSSREKAEK